MATYSVRAVLAGVYRGAFGDRRTLTHATEPSVPLTCPLCLAKTRRVDAEDR